MIRTILADMIGAVCVLAMPFAFLFLAYAFGF